MIHPAMTPSETSEYIAMLERELRDALRDRDEWKEECLRHRKQEERALARYIAQMPIIPTQQS